MSALLATSGVDGVYPAGLPVARVSQIQRRAESTFARIYCQPLAQVGAARHLLVLKPLKTQLPTAPESPPPAKSGRGKAGRS